LQNQPDNQNTWNLGTDLDHLVTTVVKAIVLAKQTQELDNALVIRDELRRLPDNLLTEVLNNVMLNLVKIDPSLCRWFILDIFLHDANPEGKADVAERINLLLADLQSLQ
jgi:hypothetical protein